jgi:hypothetical protein
MRGGVARPTKLNAATADAILFDVTSGLSMETAARRAGTSSRSARRWRLQGEQELARLTPAAWFALGVRQARASALSWQETAKRLEGLESDADLLVPFVRDGVGRWDGGLDAPGGGGC